MTRLLIGGWSYGASFIQRAWDDVDVIPFSSTPEAFGNNGQDIVIGWSLGGLLAMQAIVEGRLKPSGLVLVSSTAFFCADGTYSCGAPKAALRSMMIGIRRNRETTLSSFYRDAAAPDTLDQQDLKERLNLAGEFSEAELLEGLKELDTIDMRPHLGSIALPVLILHGSCDRIIPPEAAEYLCRGLDRAELHIHDGAGHELFFRQSGWVHDRIARFAEGI